MKLTAAASLDPALTRHTKMRAPAAGPAPTEQSLREMMAMAAAAASAAAGDASVVSAVVASTETSRQLRLSGTRSTYNRRQSISQLPPHLAGEQHKKGAPLPPVEDGARLARINEVAREIATKWVHPRGSLQYETDVLHQVRAILYMNRSLITQSFVSHVSGVSQGSLSHYVRGLFKGNQNNVEERLGAFVRTFAEGGYDKHLEDARQGHRLVGRPAMYDIPALEPTTQSILAGTGSINRPENIVDIRPPIAPPPPPQLQPAPWARQAQSALPPTPPRQPESSSRDQPSTPSDPPVRSPLASQIPQSDRARRAQQRQQKLNAAKRPRSMFPSLLDDTHELTPAVAVERAYHVLVASKWNSELVYAEPLLIPIEIYVSEGDRTLHMYTQWDINERRLSPEFLADRIRRARGLPPEFAKPASMQIRRALYDAGVVCPPPPSTDQAENRRLIKIMVELQEGDSVKVLRDEFEWDLGGGCMNSPELFAQHLCTDANVSQRHAPTVAAAIQKELVRAQAIAFGDAETRRMAMHGLSEFDPICKSLPPVQSALTRTSPEDQRAKEREENEIAIRNWFLKPIIDTVPEEAKRRREERAKQAVEKKARKELDSLRRKEAEEITKETENYEKALRDVDEQARRIHQDGGLDYRPYLDMWVGRGERCSLWMPPAIDRRRRKQAPFPMTRRAKRPTQASKQELSQKRRRLSRREAEKEESEKETRDAKVEAKDTEEIDDAETRRVYVKVRVRPPKNQLPKSRASERKRRR